MTIKDEILREISYSSYNGLEYEGDAFENSNHAVRRFFRCWLNGSYHGEASYIERRNKWRKLSDKQKRAFVIAEFSEYTAHRS